MREPTRCASVSPGSVRSPVTFPRRALAALALLALLGAAPARAQGPGGPGPKVDAALRAKAVGRVGAVLNEVYVFPDVARKMEAALQRKLKAGAYDKLTTTAELANALTRDLQEVSKDRHLAVRFAPGMPPGMAPDGPTDAASREALRRELAQDNFGFERVERLAGNVGYLDLRSFVGAELAGETAVAAMQFLGNADALIVDLRKNGGGEPSMIQLLSSYLFDKPTHLNSFYLRKGNVTEQFWTAAHVAGKRLSDVPVYVLTSGRTFSAAEEFAYNLKSLRRATIVGETTGGGAHPVEPHFLADVQLLAFVPFGRAVNPVTGTNWEGVGVKPDVDVPADKALTAAHLDALRKLQGQAKDGGQKQRYAWAAQKVEARMKPATVPVKLLESAVGQYGPHTLSYADGALWYQWRGDPTRLRALPMTADTLMFEDGMDMLRFRLASNAAGKVTGVTWLWADGRTETTPRSEN